MKQIVTTGIILSRTNFGEADRILTVITPDNGKVRLLARGVRKVRSKLAGGIELFSISRLSFIIGKGEIYTLTSTRLEKHYEHIVKDVERTMFGYDVLKIINRTTEDEVGGEYFELLKRALSAIDDAELNLDLIRLWLQLQLLKLGGHSPNLKTDTANEQLAEKQRYNFDLDKMAFSIKSGGPFNSRHIKLLRLGLNLNSPELLAKVNNVQSIVAPSSQLAAIMLKQFVHI